jgi:putative FmdB family regulatory protein
MPIYEYKCQTCGQVAEFLIKSLSGSENLSCPGCGSHNLERLISAPRLLRDRGNAPGTTCCGRTERCETPPCSMGERCRRT